jgi:xylulokinase
MEYVLGIDLGTSYFKLGLFDRNLNLCGLGRVAVEKDVGEGSLCELPTERFWKLLQNCLADALKQTRAKPADIKAVGYSSQANSFVLLDKNDKPLTPLVLWPDVRARDVSPKVKRLWCEDDFLQTTGIGRECGPRHCVNKLLWFEENRPDTWQKTKRIMTISDYLTFSLTGQRIGDAGTASLLGLLDLQSLRWWDKAFDILGLDDSMFSEPLRPGSLAGNINESGQKLFGIEAGVPFVVGSLDHHMAAVGAGVGTIADMSESTGTTICCVNLTKKYCPKRNICIGPAVENDSFYQLTLSDNGATSLQWYQQNYASGFSIEQLVKMAEEVSPGCNGLVALPGADRYGDLAGFTNRTGVQTHGHFIRALMESTAKSLAELISQLCDRDNPKRIVATGGGAKSDLWVKIKSELTGVEFIAANCDEPACKGAAVLAASTTTGAVPVTPTVIRY